jgi:hypothetical protein
MSTLLLIVVLGALALALAVDIGTTAAMMTRPTAWVVWRPRGRQAGISLRLPNEARGAQGHQGRGHASRARAGRRIAPSWIRIAALSTHRLPLDALVGTKRSRRGSMTDEESKQRILQWQNRLHEAFDYNGFLGGKFLLGTMHLEETVGQLFVQKYHGHRLLTDAFLDFFAETLQTQLASHSQYGWPPNEPNYALILFMYLTMFRAVRATEVLSVHGYPLQGYALQRSIKDQAFILCAIANNVMGFNEMFGLQDGLTPLRDEDNRKIAANRMKAERKIRSVIIGKESGLSEETQAELLSWEQLFNFETHRGLFTLFDTLKDAFKGKLVVVGPSPDETNDAMFFNRSNELNWMILRLIPCMRRKELVWSDEWTKKWDLLEESFRMMNGGLADLGKKIPLAHLEMIELKFKFGPDHYYIEPK